MRVLGRRLEGLYNQVRLLALKNTASWKMIDGKFEMVLCRRDMMDQAFYLGTYDRCLVYLVENVVKKEDTCIDIGAHTGYVTLQLASQVGGKGQVLSFEPDPRSRGILAQNCSRNGFSNVRIYGFAVGAVSGYCDLKLSSQLGWSTLFPNEVAGETVVSEVRVPIYSIDQLRERGMMKLDLDRLSFMKIDCEGAEPFVLEGMRNMLRLSSPLIWIEVNKGSLRAAGSSASAVVGTLLELGFGVFSPKFHRNMLRSPQLTLRETGMDGEESLAACSDIIALKHDAVGRLTGGDVGVIWS